MSGVFELFLDRNSLVRFRLRAADGTVIAVSTAFVDEGAAVRRIADARECAGMGLISDLRGKEPRKALPGKEAAVDPLSGLLTVIPSCTALGMNQPEQPDVDPEKP